MKGKERWFGAHSGRGAGGCKLDAREKATPLNWKPGRQAMPSRTTLLADVRDRSSVRARGAPRSSRAVSAKLRKRKSQCERVEMLPRGPRYCAQRVCFVTRCVMLSSCVPGVSVKILNGCSMPLALCHALCLACHVTRPHESVDSTAVPLSMKTVIILNQF